MRIFRVPGANARAHPTKQREVTMTISELAQQLRQRLLTRGLVSQNVLDSVADEDIIESYVTCACCGKKSVQGQALQHAIATSASVEQFLDRTGHGQNPTDQLELELT